MLNEIRISVLETKLGSTSFANEIQMLKKLPNVRKN